MALSQKYVGKILTPWFDLAEWRETRDLIYSQSFESQQAALKRLRIWKLRTPLLSSGVEGTLIILEALLQKRRDLTDYEIVQIFSTALLRFLNICAACNDRQGTFYRTAEKNNLPYWLISLRHNIAHDHKVPSRAILDCALKECFLWIKKKYWDIQDAHMKNYIISDSTHFEELVKYYAQLNILSFFNKNTDALICKIVEKLKNIIPNKLEQAVTTEDYLLVLEEYVLNSTLEDKLKDTSNNIISALIDEQYFLSVNYYLLNDVKRIPTDFTSIWLKIINLLYENRTLFSLINKLADVTESTEHEPSVKEIASLWIAELYQAFIKTRQIRNELERLKSMQSKPLDSRTVNSILESIYDDNPAYRDILTLHEPGTLPLEESKLFEERILRRPNEYILNYLELVLKFNGHTSDIIKSQYKTVKKLVQLNTSYYTDPVTVYCIGDLKELQESGGNTDKFEINQNGTKSVEKKFRKLTDAEKFSFKGYPLGLMPLRS